MTNTPKRILYVENGIGYGGAVICLRHLVRNLDRSKFTPMVVTSKTGQHYQEIADEAIWQHIPDKYFELSSMQLAFRQAKWPNLIPGSRFVINQILARTDDFVNFLPFFFRLLWTAWVFKPDIIHANNEPLCNRAALLVGKVLNIATICHVRGNLDGSIMMKCAFKLPDHFISVSHWVAENMRKKLHVPEEKISVIYDGIELDKLDINANGFEFRKKFAIAEDAFVVGLVGLLIPWKGQELFLEAAKQLRKDIPNLKMLIIGGTPDECLDYEKQLKRRATEDQIDDIVTFTGHISNMASVYNGLDVVISASTSPEPLGTMVIECMAMGRPLVGPNHGGAAEMIKEKKTGLLFAPNNVNALSSAISQLYANPELRRKIGINARTHALNTFDIQSHTHKIQNLYSLSIDQQHN